MKNLFSLFAIVVFWFVVVGCRSAEFSPQDREMVLSVDKLAAAGFTYPNSTKYEKISKDIYFDGTTQIDYEFQTPEEDDKKVLYLTNLISIEKRETDAKFNKGIQDTGLSWMLKMGGVEQEEKKGFYEYGDESTFFDLKKNGQKVGHYFAARIGRKSVLIMIVGLSFDDPEDWRAIVEPTLNKIKGYNGG